ncbi:MAG: YfhO family protein [Bacteroidia bacterium]|nr:YfhO family protein [Bacteroidia bacterium]
MEKRSFFKKYGAYFVALVLFIAAAFVYCSPVLKGRVLYAGDIQNYIGASQEVRDFHETTGEYTFWTGSMFSGMPDYQIGGAHYVSDSLLAPLTSVISHKDNPVRMLILYLICFFVLLRCFGVDKWLSIAGAFAITLSSYFLVIIPAGHYTKITTIALCAVIIGGFRLIFNGKYPWGAALTAVFTALAFKPHPQMFYYFFMLLGVLWVAEAWAHIKEKRFRQLGIATAVFALAVIVGLGTGMSNVFANAEYTSETMRGGHSDIVEEGTADNQSKSDGLDIEYATQWSYGIDESMSFLIPGFKGGANSINVGTDSKLYKDLVKNGVAPSGAEDFCRAVPTYWGDQPFTAGNVYMGAIVCFLFVLGLMVVKGPYKWGLLVATIFSVALAWGHNCLWLTELFFKYFPLYSKFRAVSSILVVAEVAMPLLGFLALKEIMDGKVSKGDLFKSIYVSGGITAGLCLFFALLGGSLFSFTSAGDASFAGQIPEWLYVSICDQRAAILRSDSLRSALFIVAAAFVVWLYAKGKLKAGAFAAVLGVLIVLDMWPVDKRYFDDDDFVRSNSAGAAAFVMTDYEKLILQDPGYFRVMNIASNTFNDSRTSYYLKSVGGYSAAKLRRYQDLIDQHLSQYHWPVIGMLNAKYIILPDDDGGTKVQINPYALGNAWFVDKLVIARNANEESAALNSIDLSHEAVLDESFASYVSDFEPVVPEDATVVLNSYSPKDLDYTCSTSQPGTIVFSEIYYPYGWKATVDGESVDHYRVNYALRALNVPAGTHNVHFTFDPDSVHKGNAISIVCIILMYLLLLAAIGWSAYKAAVAGKKQ